MCRNEIIYQQTEIVLKGIKCQWRKISSDKKPYCSTEQTKVANTKEKGMSNLTEETLWILSVLLCPLQFFSSNVFS